MTAPRSADVRARGAWPHGQRAACVLLACASLLVACGRAASGPRAHIVEMRGFAFVPARLEIAAGDTVIWVNRDIVPHTATAEGSWDSGSIAATARWQVIPSQKGIQEYTCTFHPTMRGTIVVR